MHLLAITGGTLHELLKNGVLKLSWQTVAEKPKRMEVVRKSCVTRQIDITEKIELCDG